MQNDWQDPNQRTTTTTTTTKVIPTEKVNLQKVFVPTHAKHPLIHLMIKNNEPKKHVTNVDNDYKIKLNDNEW
jgi:hypothetical protein